MPVEQTSFTHPATIGENPLQEVPFAPASNTEDWKDGIQNPLNAPSPKPSRKRDGLL
jgi:hypothetical protein